MTYPRNHQGLHVPEPTAGPAGKADFSHLVIPDAGTVAKPAVDIAADDMRGHAYDLIRVLDAEGRAVGPWNPGYRWTT